MRAKAQSAVTPLLMIGIALSFVMPACSPRNNADAPAKDPDSEGALEDAVDFAYGTSGTWDDESDVARLGAQRALENLGYAVTLDDTWIEHAESGFRFRAKLLDYVTLDDGEIRTVTVIQSVHPTLVPDGVFEYQHSKGDTLENSVQEGYELWAQIDLVVLLDALRDEPEECTILKTSFPERDGMAALHRRMVLGPLQRMATRESSQTDVAGGDGGIRTSTIRSVPVAS